LPFSFWRFYRSAVLVAGPGSEKKDFI